MASATSLEERFNKAVQTIQSLPPNGILQPANLTKLIFYGLYKQATIGPCQQARPSMFNYVARAKWEAWDRCRGMSKDQAMQEYLDEIRKIIATMPQTGEVVEFAKSMGFMSETEDNQVKENDTLTSGKNIEREIAEASQPINTSDFAEMIVIPEKDFDASSSLSSSSISSSDVDEFYDDPSDILSQEMASNTDFQEQTTHSTGLHPSSHSHGSQNGASVLVRSSNRGEHNSTTHLSSTRFVNSANGVHHSASSIVSGGTNDRYSSTTYNRETQRAILTALTKLQQDLQNISDRLNRLETIANLLQQRQLSSSRDLIPSYKWYPLSGFRSRAIAFILFWPFIAYVLIRLYLRAIITIRFRR